MLHFSTLTALLLGIILFQVEAGHRRNTDGMQLKSRFLKILTESSDPEFVGLSPWELHVVNDLLVEVMLLKCQNVNRTVARGMKTFITSRVSKAPRVETMDENFISVYGNLVKCMDYIDKRMKTVEEEKSKKVERTTPAEPMTYDVSTPEEYPTVIPVIVNEEEASTIPISEHQHGIKISINGQIVEISPISSTNDKNDEPKKIVGKDDFHKTFDKTKLENKKEHSKQKPKFVHENSDDDSILSSASGLLSIIWNRSMDWVTSWGRKRRGVENVDAVPLKRHSQNAKAGYLQSIARKNVLRKFKEELEFLAHLARRSCPSKYRPNHTFTNRAIKEIVEWIGYDLVSAMDAYEKYFIQGRFGMEVQHCLLNS